MPFGCADTLYNRRHSREQEKLRAKCEAHYYAKYIERGKSHHNAETAAGAMARRKYP